MYNKKHKLPATLVMVCIIGLLGFKDTGIFVKEYAAIQEEGQPIQFSKEESIEVLRETKDSYIVGKDGNSYQVPKDVMIKTTNSGQKYEVIKYTGMTDQPNGNFIEYLNIGEEVQALKFEGEYGLFETRDGIKGYIDLVDLEKIAEESITSGISKVDRVIKNDKLLYTLVKGEMVAIKDFKNNLYTIIDDDGNEFNINEDYIEIRRTIDKVTRGNNVSKRAKDVNKVMIAAYDALGSPYVAGGASKAGYDCSGLTSSVYKEGLGINLQRSSYTQVNDGKAVARADLIPGDLIFFKTSGPNIGHVGVYIGDNNMIHASSGQRKIMISDINSTYYKTRYVASRRIIE